MSLVTKLDVSPFPGHDYVLAEGHLPADDLYDGGFFFVTAVADDVTVPDLPALAMRELRNIVKLTTVALELTSGRSDVALESVVPVPDAVGQLARRRFQRRRAFFEDFCPWPDCIARPCMSGSPCTIGSWPIAIGSTSPGIA